MELAGRTQCLWQPPPASPLPHTSRLDDAAPGGHWRLFSPRGALQPQWSVGADGVVLEGGGRPGVFGSLFRRCQLDSRGGAAYRVRAEVVPLGDVPALRDVARVLLRWRTEAEVLQTDYAHRLLTPNADGAPWRVDQVVVAPPGAVAVDVHLVFRWAPQAGVQWRGAWLECVGEPAPRTATVSAVALGPYRAGQAEVCVNEAEALLREAGRRGSDLACLTEFTTGYVESAEGIPGPTCARFGQMARQYGMYVIWGQIERERDLLYNTAVLLDRRGEVVGRYRKIHLTEGEIFTGITPGDRLGLFDTDFGCIGVTICYDNKFPEIHQALADGGAELMVSVSEGDGREGGFTHDIVAQARAINHGVWVVAAGRATPNSGQAEHWYSVGTFVISPQGYVLTNGGKRGPHVQTVEVDLSQAIRGTISGWGCESWSQLACAGRRPLACRAEPVAAQVAVHQAAARSVPAQARATAGEPPALCPRPGRTPSQVMPAAP